jgi:hypothetical protein
VIHQGYENDERDEAGPVMADHVDEFLFLVGGKLFLEIPHHVGQYVHMLGRCGFSSNQTRMA